VSAVEALDFGVHAGQPLSRNHNFDKSMRNRHQFDDAEAFLLRVRRRRGAFRARGSAGGGMSGSLS